MKLSVDGCIRRSVYAAFAVGLAGFAVPALAQSEVDPNTGTIKAEADVDGGTKAADNAGSGAPIALERVQVTGTRIKSANLVSSSPIVTVGSAEVKFTGTTRVEDLLNALPQVFAEQGGNLANGATGTATVNLRNLGSSRTLVLIDGKRVQPGDPGDSTADLNFIPAALIDRVDVLTGGASSTYGADAVAGVVNFIMKRNFEGVRVEAQRAVFQHDNDSSFDQVTNRSGFGTPKETIWDGQSWDLTAVIGANSANGKGNVTAYATYRQIDPIDQGGRDFSRCSLANRAGDPNDFTCAGSGTNATGRFDPADPDGAAGPNRNPPALTLDQGTGNFRPLVATDLFNFNPYNYFQRNDERYTLGAFANYEVNKNFEPYASFMFMDDRTNAVIAPSGAFNGGSILEISRDNPFLSDQQEAALFEGVPATDNTATVSIARRNVEGGGRDSDLRHTSFRIVTGVRGDIAGDFSYDASYQYGKTIRDNIYRNDFSVARTALALDVVTDPATGLPACRAAVSGADPNCVPYNIFQVGGVTPAALNYLQVPGFNNGIVQERVATASVSGTLGFALPWAKENVGIAVGVEYRDEESQLENDISFSTGDLAGQGGATLDTAGAFDVKEIFGELKVPIWQGRPFAEDLSLELGYRFSDYSSIDTTEAYKIAGNYAPVKDVKFRGSFNRAVRAPNIGELAQPTNVVLDGSSDPCAGEIGTDGVVSGGATREQCANDPLIAANPSLYGAIEENPANQYNGLVGTDPNLGEEKADTYTGGVVFTPTFLRGFTASVDYFDIEVDGFVAGIGADNILNTCYQSGGLCDLIRRDPNPGITFGSLFLGNNGFVIDTTTNTGKLQTSGIDLKADYRVKTTQLGLPNFGTVVVDYVGTYLFDLKVQPIPGDASSEYECVGKFGLQCGIPTPEYRHKLRTSFQLPWYSATASLAWRYIGEVEVDDEEISSVNDRDRKLKQQHYFDVFTSAKFLQKYTVRAGVNNVLDNDPPVVGSGALPGVVGSGNTFPQVYDALGRFIFGSVTLDF